jgi:hypothetical protein
MEALTWWAKVVQNYSSRNLTVESDKLPALASCSCAIQALNKGIYYARLWERTLTNGLLWQSVDGKAASRPKEYRSPSWSWAAINEEVKCCITGTHDALSTKLIKTLSGEAEYLGSDVFGQVKAMPLVLEGVPCVSQFGIRDTAKLENGPQGTEFALFNLSLLPALAPTLLEKDRK